MRGVIGWARVLMFVFGCSGCSYIFVSGKPANVEALPPSEPVECTTSKVAPVLDTVFGALEVARTGYALSLKDSDYSGQRFTRGADIGLGVAFVALFASSAIYGYVKTGSCAEAKERHERARQQFLTPVGTPPPAPPRPQAGPPEVSPPSPVTPPSNGANPPPSAAPTSTASPTRGQPASASTAPSGAFPPVP